jgi:hypothetical protein
MKPINNAERRKRLVQFGVLYTASSIAMIITGLSIIRSRSDINPTTYSATHSSAAAGRTIDSLRGALSTAENDLQERDSLLAVLRMQHQSAPVSAPLVTVEQAGKDDLTDRRLADKLQHQNAIQRDSITHMQTEKAAIQQKLDDTQKASDALTEQVANLRHSTETLRARLTETSRPAAIKDATQDESGNRISTLVANNAALEKESLQLADQLRFAQIDCNLSRADARQVVYNDRQRQDLLADALRMLNDLSKSNDPGIQREAKQKLALLKNIASTVHD